MTIQGERHYLWLAVDQDGDAIDILIQRHRHKKVVERFFLHLLRGQAPLVDDRQIVKL